MNGILIKKKVSFWNKLSNYFAKLVFTWYYDVFSVNTDVFLYKLSESELSPPPPHLPLVHVSCPQGMHNFQFGDVMSYYSDVTMHLILGKHVHESVYQFKMK